MKKKRTALLLAALLCLTLLPKQTYADSQTGPKFPPIVEETTQPAQTDGLDGNSPSEEVAQAEESDHKKDQF